METGGQSVLRAPLTAKYCGHGYSSQDLNVKNVTPPAKKCLMEQSGMAQHGTPGHGQPCGATAQCPAGSGSHRSLWRLPQMGAVGWHSGPMAELPRSAGLCERPDLLCLPL